MVSVNNNALVDKLHNLNSTQQSIETVSAWCSFYRKDARKVVSIWEQEFVKMPMPKQLAMSYLANDILQNSRKKGPEFVHEFYKTLPRAVKHLLKHGDDKVKRAVNRLVDIWEDRKVSARMIVEVVKSITINAFNQASDLLLRSLVTVVPGPSERSRLKQRPPSALAVALHRSKHRAYQQSLSLWRPLQMP